MKWDSRSRFEHHLDTIAHQILCIYYWNVRLRVAVQSHDQIHVSFQIYQDSSVRWDSSFSTYLNSERNEVVAAEVNSQHALTFLLRNRLLPKKTVSTSDSELPDELGRQPATTAKLKQEAAIQTKFRKLW